MGEDEDEYRSQNAPKQLLSILFMPLPKFAGFFLDLFYHDLITNAVIIMNIFCLLQSLQLLVTFCRHHQLLSNWLVLLLGGLTPISVSLFTQKPPPSQGMPPHLKILPQISPVSKLRLKVDHLKLGLNWDRICCWNLGKGGKKGHLWWSWITLWAWVRACAFLLFPLNRGFGPQRQRWGDVRGQV